jgi:DNA-binding PadR family transcriptional regulator
MFDPQAQRDAARGARFARRGPHGHGFPGGFGPGFGGFGPDFGPFGGPRGRARARRGDVRLVILSLLGEEESNGYGLIRSIAERTEGRWRPSPGSVYPTLQQLVDEGLVVSTGAGRGDTYSLSDEGRTYLTENAEAIEAAWGGLPGREGDADEFWTAFMKLAKATKQFSSEATPEQRSAIAAKLDTLRKEMYGTLAE